MRDIESGLTNDPPLLHDTVYDWLDTTGISIKAMITHCDAIIEFPDDVSASLFKLAFKL